jgi:hypothetical protein
MLLGCDSRSELFERRAAAIARGFRRADAFWSAVSGNLALPSIAYDDDAEKQCGYR